MNIKFERLRVVCRRVASTRQGGERAAVVTLRKALAHYNGLAQLTKVEDQFLGTEFEYYYNNVRCDNKRALAYAWRKTVEMFPRLAPYEGGKS